MQFTCTKTNIYINAKKYWVKPPLRYIKILELVTMNNAFIVIYKC